MASGTAVLPRRRIVSMGDVDALARRLKDRAIYEPRIELSYDLREAIAIINAFRREHSGETLCIDPDPELA
jgi:hypothetical protein